MLFVSAIFHLLTRSNNPSPNILLTPKAILLKHQAHPLACSAQWQFRWQKHGSFISSSRTEPDESQLSSVGYQTDLHKILHEWTYNEKSCFSLPPITKGIKLENVSLVRSGKTLDASQKFTNAFDESRISSNQGQLQLLLVDRSACNFNNFLSSNPIPECTFSQQKYNVQLLLSTLLCYPCWSTVGLQTIRPYGNWTNVVFQQIKNKQNRTGCAHICNWFQSKYHKISKRSMKS